MAEREMSGKDLLEQLYRGLDTVPAAVEAEMDAQELRELVPGPAAHEPPPQAVPTAQVASDAPASRTNLTDLTNLVRSPLMVVCGVVLAGTIAAAAVLHQSGTRTVQSSQSVVAAPSPAPEQVASLAAPEETKYVKLVNPFDETEVFTFPPGMSESEARDQMAALLLKRAIERKAHIPRAGKLAAEPRATYTGRGS